MMWGSPLVANGHVYIGVASLGDCPLTPSGMIELSEATGVIENTFNANPPGCTGSGIWGSPTLDDHTGLIYVDTGNPSPCKATQLYGDAIVALHASDLTAVDSWSVPVAEQIKDGDFGTVPTLFSGTVTPGGTPHQLVGATNKNGTFYVWDRSDLHDGPLARLKVADTTQQNISPAAYDGTWLYVASKHTTIAGANGTVTDKGTVRAFNPNDLSTAGVDHGATGDGVGITGSGSRTGRSRGRAADGDFELGERSHRDEAVNVQKGRQALRGTDDLPRCPL